MNILTEDHLSNLPPDLIQKAKSMSKAYEYIYCVENMIRLHLIDKLGTNFLPTGKVLRGIKARKADEQNHKWIPFRGQSDFYYTDFSELIGIIDSHWEHVKSDFPNQNWIKSKLEDLARFRNMIAHNSYLDNSDLELVRVYFNTIAKQLKISEGPNNSISQSQPNGFVLGLKNAQIYTYDELCSGITHTLDFPLDINVVPFSLSTSFEQIGPVFCVNFNSSRVQLYPEFKSIDFENLEDLYGDNNSILFEIGQYDIDNDGTDEIFICLRIYDEEFALDNTIMINIFKFYPPAFEKHSHRSENWELFGPFSTGTISGEPKANIIENTIYISRNLRSYHDEWTYLKGEFIHRGI